MADIAKAKVDPVMEKPWQRMKRLERYDFWGKSAYPPMEIEPMRMERSRLTKEMTPEERALRKQWVKDQAIRHEKRSVPQLRPMNIFRRIYRAPLNMFESTLQKFVSPLSAHVARSFVGKGSIAIALTYGVWYHLKYHQNNWTREGGWIVTKAKPTILTEFMPHTHFEYEEKHPSEFFDRGFKSRKALLYKD